MSTVNVKQKGLSHYLCDKRYNYVNYTKQIQAKYISGPLLSD